MKKIDRNTIVGLAGLLLIALYLVLALFITPQFGSKETETARYPLFFQLFKKLGYEFSDYKGSQLPEEKSFLIIFDFQPDQKALAPQLLTWVESGGKLLVAGMHSQEEPFFETPLSIKKIKSTTIKKSHSQDIQNLHILEAKLMNESIDADEVLLDTNQGHLVTLHKIGQGELILISDSLLFQDHFVRDLNHALFLHHLFTPYYHQRIKLYHPVLAAHTQNLPTPVFILFKPHLVFLTLQLLLILALWMFYQGKRFGNPLRFNPFARRALTEHLKATSFFYQKSRAFSVVTEIHFTYFLFRIKTLLKLNPKTSLKELQELCQKRKWGTLEEIQYLTTPQASTVQEQLNLERKRQKFLNHLKNKKNSKLKKY